MWYQAYESLWRHLNTKIEDLQKQSYAKTYKDLVSFIQESDSMDTDTIPTAVLLTGINQFDHIVQFNKLCVKLQSEMESLIIVLESRSCPTAKATIEKLITSFIQAKDELDETEEIMILKKFQLNLWCFKKWYETKFNSGKKPRLIVMMPDFEGFAPEILQNLILVLHGYRQSLPFVFVFGVATSFGVIHETLPYNVTNKITVKVFQSVASPVILNNVIDHVLLAPDCPFRLSGTTFRMLTDIFLFYDFSVHGFVQGLKVNSYFKSKNIRKCLKLLSFQYCMMEHFSQGNIYAFCSNDLEPHEIIAKLNKDDLDDIRHLYSFRKFVESRDNPEEIIKLLTDDKALRKRLPDLVLDLKRYWNNFQCALALLHELCANLPKAPFGKNVSCFFLMF